MRQTRLLNGRLANGTHADPASTGAALAIDGISPQLRQRGTDRLRTAASTTDLSAWVNDHEDTIHRLGESATQLRSDRNDGLADSIESCLVALDPHCPAGIRQTAAPYLASAFFHQARREHGSSDDRRRWLTTCLTLVPNHQAASALLDTIPE